MLAIRKQLSIPVENYTTPGAVTAKPQSSFEEMKSLMASGGFRHLPILHGKEVVGLVSQRDLMLIEGLGRDLAGQISAEDIMHKDVYVVSPDVSLEEVVFEMSERKIGSAIITDPEDGTVGIFTSTDALNALIELMRGEMQEG